MLICAIQSFIASNGMHNPKYLADGVGVQARNLDVFHGDMRGINGQTDVHTIEGYSSQQISLYRMGRDVPSDVQYWLSSDTEADYARSMLSEDATERTYYTGVGAPKYTDNTLLGSPPYPSGYVDLGVPAPASAMTLALNTAGTGTNETRVYLDTFVRANGDESAPNAATATITVKGGSTVNISALSPVPSGLHGITMRRIYVYNGSGEFMRCVSQLASLTTAVDTGSRTLVLGTGGSYSRPAWLVPPDDLFGLMEAWNGMMIAFLGKSYRSCVPYKPHAWPIEYEHIIGDTVVGGAKWGSSILLATTGIPRVLTGSTPSALNDSPIFTTFNAACVSKRSIKSVGHGVCWATNKGLAYHGQRGTMLLTEFMVEKADWLALNPSGIIGACWGRYYVGFYSATQAFMIDTTNPVGVIWLDTGAKGVFEDSISGDLYTINTGNVVSKFNVGSIMPASFTSRIYSTPRKVCAGWAKVVATTFPVTFELHAGGVLRHSQTVTSREPFILADGYMEDEFQVIVSGVGPIEGVAVAEQLSEIP